MRRLTSQRDDSVAVPNVDVYLNAITNQTAYPERRYAVLVGIHYNDDLRRALKVAG